MNTTIRVRLSKLTQLLIDLDEPEFNTFPVVRVSRWYECEDSDQMLHVDITRWQFRKLQTTDIAERYS